MKKSPLFGSERMSCDLYCLRPGQSQKAHAHAASDKVYNVLRGTGRFTIGDEEADLGPGHAVIARAGVPHGVRNEGEGDLVLLVVMAPKPR
jgi:mannose-6-phosphate isomerase-like protein (cupin superfamily)